MTRYFITGTDTDVGKTTVASILTLAMDADYWKPIQSGIPDSDTIVELTGISNDRIIPAIYTFKTPLSPDQAALRENITIDLDQCHLKVSPQRLIVEGAGGVLVPLNSQQMMIDLMKQLNLPIIIVARGTLGTINHTLMTIEIIKQNGLPIHGVVFNGELNPENQIAIEKWGNVNTLFHVPLIENMNKIKLQNWVKENHKKIKDKLL